MTIFGKPLDDVVGSDLEALVGVREGPTLEFKQQMYKPGDDGNRELLRDIAALANAEGGFLILGIEEDAEGVARGLRNVPAADKASERLISCCTDNIAERIPGLRARVVATVAGTALAVWIPRSYRRPHMITFQGRGEFWIRHDRHKSRMSIAEVRNAVTATEEAEVKVERFIAERDRVLAAEQPSVHLTLTATPVLLETGRIDSTDSRLQELLRNPPSYRQNSAALSDHRAQVWPTLHGLEAQRGELQKLRVFRNGHIEFITADAPLVYDQPDEARGTTWRALRPFIVAELVRNFVHFTDAARQLVALDEPYLIRLALWRGRGLAMDDGTPRRWASDRNFRIFDDAEEIAVAPVMLSVDEPADAVTRKIVDVFWNAFHHPRCPFFDAQGRFYIP